MRLFQGMKGRETKKARKRGEGEVGRGSEREGMGAIEKSELEGGE